MWKARAQAALEACFNRPYDPPVLRHLQFSPKSVISSLFMFSVRVHRFLEAGKASTPRTSLHTSLLCQECSSLGEESNAKDNNPQKKSCTRAICLETKILQPMVHYWEKQQRVFFFSNIQNCFREPRCAVRQLGMPVAGLWGWVLFLSGAGISDLHPSRKPLDSSIVIDVL